jgi:hypothetical protein
MNPASWALAPSSSTERRVTFYLIRITSSFFGARKKVLIEISANLCLSDCHMGIGSFDSQ